MKNTSKYWWSDRELIEWRRSICNSFMVIIFYCSFIKRFSEANSRRPINWLTRILHTKSGQTGVYTLRYLHCQIQRTRTWSGQSDLRRPNKNAENVLNAKKRFDSNPILYIIVAQLLSNCQWNNGVAVDEVKSSCDDLAHPCQRWWSRERTS